MFRIHLLYIVILACSFLVGCDENKTPALLAQADLLSETDPSAALDSLAKFKSQLAASSQYVQNKYELIYMKARSKAYQKLTNIDKALSLTDYFTKHGNARDQMMAHYYLGETFRDLDDGPKAIVELLEAAKIAEHTKEVVDTALLSCVYAQISSINDLQGNYLEAKEAAYKEIDLSERHGNVAPIDYMDLAITYRNMGMYDSCRILYEKSFNLILQQGSAEQNVDLVAEQLGFFSGKGYKEAAERRLRLLPSKGEGASTWPGNVSIVKANYYEAFGPKDSAIYYYRIALAINPNKKEARDAAYALKRLYEEKGNLDSAYHYSNAYMNITRQMETELKNGSIKRVQEKFKYSHEETIEKWLARKVEKQSWTIISVSVVAILFFVTSVILFIIMQRRRKQYASSIKEIDQRSANSWSAINEKINALSDLVNTKETTDMDTQLDEIRASIGDLVAEAQAGDASAIVANSQRKGNEPKAEAYGIYDFFERSADNGQKVKDENKWDELQAHVAVTHCNELQQLLSTIDKHKSEHLRIYCLMCIGLTAKQVATIMGLTPTTTYRRLGKIKSIIPLPD